MNSNYCSDTEGKDRPGCAEGCGVNTIATLAEADPSMCSQAPPHLRTHGCVQPMGSAMQAWMLKHPACHLASSDQP